MGRGHLAGLPDMRVDHESCIPSGGGMADHNGGPLISQACICNIHNPVA